MKKILLAAFVAVVALTSCNKENGLDREGQAILISLPNATTRAIEAQVGAGESTISASNTVIFLLNGNSVVTTDVFTTAEISAKKKHIENVNSSVNGVLIVANIPATNLATVRALTSATAIRNFPYLSLSQNSSAGVLDKLMMGEDLTLTVNPVNPVNLGTDYKEAIVELNSVTARMEIAGVIPGEGIDNITLVSVWINNYYADAFTTTPTFHNTANSVWPTTGVGVSTGTIANPAPITYTNPEYYNAGTGSVSHGTLTPVYAYQVFAGNLPSIVMLVKGEYEAGYSPEAGKDHFLKYVTFKTYTDASNNLVTAFAANTIYKVGLTSGITVNARDLGDEPETTMFDLGVIVSITPWTVVSVTPGV